jgi:pimeloyl-ACP methyl ester carboxylesterase
MPLFTAHGRQLSYHVEGEGFPLLLIPDAGGAIQDWVPTLSLLAELCRVIAYEYTPRLSAVSTPTPSEAPVDDLVTLLKALAVERAYGAGYAGGGDVALRFAQRVPGRLEGLLLINPVVRRCYSPYQTCLFLPSSWWGKKRLRADKRHPHWRRGCHTVPGRLSREPVWPRVMSRPCHWDTPCSPSSCNVSGSARSYVEPLFSYNTGRGRVVWKSAIPFRSKHPRGGTACFS